MSAPQILILPGLYNSGPDHWQTRWQNSLPNAQRVEQRSWDAPDCKEWVAMLNAAIADCAQPVVLVAHSLGCALVNWWASMHGTAAHASRVKAALLVAPPNVERPDFPEAATGFSPMPTRRLPFNTIVIASSDDPYCALPKAQAWADG